MVMVQLFLLLLIHPAALVVVVVGDVGDVVVLLHPAVGVVLLQSLSLLLLGAPSLPLLSTFYR